MGNDISSGQNRSKQKQPTASNQPPEIESSSSMRSKVEGSLKHLPNGLKQLLMEYWLKRESKGLGIPDELKILEPLAEYYQNWYEVEPERWTAGLRAHALWIACSLRDPKNSDYIRSAFRLMNSKLSPDQLSAMNAQNKELIKECREKHRTLTSEVKSLLSNIDSADWCNNITFMQEFSEAIKEVSCIITTDVKDIFGRIMDQSVLSVGKPPPCGVSVIAIGSLARGETTSYSDIEYMFLVEDGSDSCIEYFRNLAFQSYYFLSMLGESNLLTYYIKEVNAIGFVDKCPKAFRIDGLADKAGNMPTGNGLSGSELMFTVDQLVGLYQDIIQNRHKGPDKGVSSDVVDMITHRALVWSTGNGQALYGTLNEKLKEISHSNNRKVKSLNLLKEDLENYNFLPDRGNIHSGHQEIKWYIYRYPSLLLTDLDSTLDLKSETNWETISKLVSRGQCSQETATVLAFLLATALFIRIDCYHFYNEQKDKVTLFPSQQNSSQYSCPRDLFVLMMSYLFPLKSLMLETLYNDIIDDASVADYIPALLNIMYYLFYLIKPLRNRICELRGISDITIPPIQQDTLTAVCTTHFYCDRAEAVISEFVSRYGEETVFDKVEVFLSKISEIQCELLLVSLQVTSGLTERHIKLVESASKLYVGVHHDELMACCYLLTNPDRALQHAAKWLETIPKNDSYGRFNASLMLAECHKVLGDLDSCDRLLESTSNCLDKMERTGCTSDEISIARSTYLKQLGKLKYRQTDYSEYLKSSLQALAEVELVYGPGVIHTGVSSALKDVALAYEQLNQYREALVYYQKSLDMEYRLFGATEDHPEISLTLMNIGSMKSNQGNFKEGMDFYIRSYEMRCRLYANITPPHPHITLCVHYIARCYYDMSEFKEALRWYQKEHTNLSDAGKDTQALTVCIRNIGHCQMKIKDFDSAIISLTELRKLYNESLQKGEDEAQLPTTIDCLTKCQHDTSPDDGVWEYNSLPGVYVVRKRELAVCTHHMGLCYMEVQNYENASKSFGESLKMYAEINQEGRYDPILTNIMYLMGRCHFCLLDYQGAILWHQKQYANLTGADQLDYIELAVCTYNIGGCYLALKDYKSALVKLAESLKLYERIQHDGNYGHTISGIMGMIALSHSRMSDYSTAIQWYELQHTNLTGANVIDKESLAVCIDNLGQCHLHLRDFKSAVDLFTRGSTLYAEINLDGKYDKEIEQNRLIIEKCEQRIRDFHEVL